MIYLRLSRVGVCGNNKGTTNAEEVKDSGIENVDVKGADKAEDPDISKADADVGGVDGVENLNTGIADAYTDVVDAVEDPYINTTDADIETEGADAAED